MTISNHTLAKLQSALPFWMSLGLIPLAFIGAGYGGWTVFLLPLVTWYLFSLLDFAVGLNTENADPQAPEDDLFWYKAITIAWAPLQFVTVFGLIYLTAGADHLATWEKVMLFFGIGVITGTVGINYSHELMHQKNKTERRMADILLAMVLYSHFRSEHLLVHHRYVATPRDPVSARMNESFYRFYPRVLHQSFWSAWGAEKAMLERQDLPALISRTRFGCTAAAAWVSGPCPDPWRMGRCRAVSDPGRRRDLAAGAGQLHRTLRPDAQTSGRRKIRTRAAASFVERRAQGVELAADQFATPFGSSLQTGSPFSCAANLFRVRSPAIALWLSDHDDGGDGAPAVATRDEPAGAQMARHVLPRDYGMDGLHQNDQPPAALSGPR